MAHYLLSVHAEVDAGPDVDAPPAEATQHQYEEILALEAEMRSAGAWLFSGRLTGPEVATVVRAAADGEVLTMDGPFVESKEHLAGFYIVEADDLDGALGWARRTSAIIGMPIEVRPFWDIKA